MRQTEFVNALTDPQQFSPCILWCQPRPETLPFPVEPPTPWQPDFVDRLAIAEKPGQHSLHHQGYFYCLDFSSVFAASPLGTISEPIHLVFDMCASPGGKSIFAWVALQPQLLITNEVIGKRNAALISNLRRCQVHPAIALTVDSQVLAQSIPKTAQVVTVDAPCTGQSLLAKGGKAEGCFHPININKNANRQKRILANSAQLVAPQGYLAYMTCTYSPDENEEVSQWFLERFPQFEPRAIAPLANYQSHLTDMPCYRMWPQDRLGAGAFTVLFQNTEVGSRNPLPEEFLAHPRVTFL
ncbi:MAG: RsmB/NOP family class I SAM-dependent RNA methyltransferase [Leptolyngbyaceae bacterium]|nr:RsmB/NOP family class I SAM-dependent RNA methyltransferase [Leptolyngbyaceae bacterium]